MLSSQCYKQVTTSIFSLLNSTDASRLTNTYISTIQKRQTNTFEERIH